MSAAAIFIGEYCLPSEIDQFIEDVETVCSTELHDYDSGVYDYGFNDGSHIIINFNCISINSR